MRLIDGDQLIEDLRSLYQEEGWDRMERHFSLRDMEFNIGFQMSVMIPESHAEPVRRAHWIVYYHGDTHFTYLCSACGIGSVSEKTNYCPYCGAKMWEEVEHECTD